MIAAARHYYNDNDPQACAWLRELIRRGHLPDGDVDERSILDVRPDELSGYTSCHFFAGIGGWPYALRLAGWPDDRPIWTGSPPCFPAEVLVTTRNGIIPISEVKVGDQCLTHRGRWKPVVRTGKAVKPTVTLVGHGHFGLTTTADHPFLSRTRTIRATRLHGKPIRKKVLTPPEWSRAEDMPGKWWGSPRTYPGGEVPQNPVLDDWSFGFVAGLYLGDGWSGRGNSPGRLILGVNADKARDIRARLPAETFQENTAKTGVRLTFVRPHLGSFLAEHFGSGSHGKRIPLWAMSASRDFKDGLVSGWDLTDGTREKMSGSRRITTASRDLAVTGRMLLLTMGFSVSLRKIETPPVTEIDGRTVQQADYYTISRSQSRLYREEDQLHVWFKCKHLSPDLPREVFDLEVEDDHSFVADGMIVHNCQPFSVAGAQKGREDARHVAPRFAELVRACRPAVLFGEQVASADVIGKVGRGNRPGFAGTPPWAWFDDLSHRLEAARYAVGAVDIPAAGVGAPHIRQRLFFGAVRLADGLSAGWAEGGTGTGCGSPAKSSSAGRLVNRIRTGLEGHAGHGDQRHQSGRNHPNPAGPTAATGGDGRVADSQWPRPPDSPWRAADWLYCRDGKWRPAQPGTFPLADRVPARVGRLRGYGNAIVPQVGAEFIRSFTAALSALDGEACHG